MEWTTRIFASPGKPLIPLHLECRLTAADTESRREIAIPRKDKPLKDMEMRRNRRNH